MIHTDFIVIGAGIIGLATAQELRRRYPKNSIAVIEKEPAASRHQTGRNSGVIHAGVYYKPGSLKARLCRQGVTTTINFCRTHDIRYEQCGKLIVATDETEKRRLDGLEERSKANELDFHRLSEGELREKEPNIRGCAALLVKNTGIVDYGEICKQLVDVLKDDGVEFYFDTNLIGLDERSDEIVAETIRTNFSCKIVLACAGLQSDKIAEFAGLGREFQIIPFRGEYYRLPDKYNDVSTHLIYPVPDPAYPFLGVHLTKMIGGYVTVGPNAVLSFGRETYLKNRPSPKDVLRMGLFPGFWKLLFSNLDAGIHEAKGSAFKCIYLDRCRKYCPSIELDDLQSYPTGIRAQAVGRDGQMIEDFLIKQTTRSIHVCNAPSPAATAAFPIATEIINHAEVQIGAII